jgi:antitoxin component YwqK of YwqJK toxin-antitoxin module
MEKEINIKLEYYENGFIKSKINYNSGLYEFWYNNGIKSCEYTLLNGLYQGLYEEYNYKGEITKQLFYFNGRVIS